MIQTKHQLIGSDLRARIARGDLKPGHALPSQSQLMAQYSVAQGTVRQALDRLQADGLVVAYRGKGTFVAKTPATDKSMAQPVRSIGLMVISNIRNDVIVTDQLLTLDQAVADLSYELAVRVFRPDDEDGPVDWAMRHAGVVLWGPGRRTLVDRLLAHRLPVVVMGELVDGECPAGASWVRFDLDSLLAMPLQLMTAMGHRHVWFVNRGSSAYFRMLSQIFARHAAASGMAQTSREVILERPADEASLLDHLALADTKPTALLIEGDIRACRIIHVLQSGAWPVPQRIGVLALGSAEAHRLGVPDLYRIILPADAGVVAAAGAMIEAINTGRIVRHVIAPRIAMGRTCLPVPPG